MGGVAAPALPAMGARPASSGRMILSPCPRNPLAGCVASAAAAPPPDPDALRVVGVVAGSFGPQPVGTTRTTMRTRTAHPNAAKDTFMVPVRDNGWGLRTRARGVGCGPR